MSIPVLVIVLGTLIIAGIIIGGGLLWLSARLFRVRPFSFQRGILIWGALTVVAMTLTALSWSTLGPSATWPATIATWLIGVLICHRAMPGSTWQQVGAYVVALVASLLVNIGIGLGVRHTLVEAFVVPTGSMATTIIGQHHQPTCRACGYAWLLDTAPGMRRVAKQTTPPCPMCGTPAHADDMTTVHDGDRMVCDKLATPKRWDVVVFKAPHDPDTSLVSRLVGMPGDSIQISGGEVFIHGELAAKSFNVRSELWTLVDDSNYTPAGKARRFGWTSAHQAWTAEGLGYRCDPPNDGRYVLTFDGTIDDTLAYNAMRPMSIEPTWVRDVRVELELNDATQGAIQVDWRCGEQHAMAVFGRGDTFIMVSGDRRAADAGSATLALSRRVIFEVRDGWCRLVRDGQLVCELQMPADMLQAYRADPAGPVIVSITASGGTVALDRLAVYRDVHYLHRSPTTSVPGRGGDKPLTLGSDEHFMLGDNTAVANDSRFWDEPIPPWQGRIQAGAVPTDLILGVAKWRYWPPSRWAELR